MGKPIILVMVQGRPRIIREIEPLTDAILMAYLPGQEGGRAIADALFGITNPSGKLPYTYPKYTGNILPYYHKKTDIRDVNWGYDGFYPQYPFGHGLSYTTFTLSNLKLDVDTIQGEGSVKLQANLTNTGARTGKTAVELYIKDQIASVAPDAKKLIAFQKHELLPGEQTTVYFEVDTQDLKFVDAQNQWVVEPGTFTLSMSIDPNKPLQKDIRYIK